jgi:asparagine synthase (glutamine-hydrolysing)
MLLRSGAASEATVHSMCEQIRHRGPDDEGIYVDGACGIGMRRLSIIDLSTGHQPMANEDGTVWIVFNGEIYEYQRLRGDLERKGHRFKTHSDTETLLHLWEEKGVEGLAELRGMFACAIWDSRRRRLMLARDRFGKKPLYYALLPSGLYFASEIKCLRAAGIPLTIDPEALRLYLQLQYIPDPWSAYKEVKKLPPGSWLTCSLDGDVKQGRYWRLPVPGKGHDGPKTEDEACTRIRQAVEDAVRVRMIADVPLGAFLSGGIDSSIVVACMARHSSAPVKTFSIGFEEAAYNELPYAELVAKKYATDHKQVIVRPDAVQLVEKLVHHFDEPFGDSSAIPTYIVSEVTARRVKVALSGDGGDELFVGYTRFLDAARLETRMRGVPQAVRVLGHWLAEALPYRAYGKNYLRMISRRNALERYFEENSMPYFFRKHLLQPKWMPPAGEAAVRSVFGDAVLANSEGILAQALYYEAVVNLPGDMLVKVDRMSMANSLEVRCPLLDAEVAAVASSIPNELKIAGGKTKSLLIRTFADLLPSELLNRSKMGFGVPLANWFRGPLRPMLWDALNGSRFLSRGIVNGGFLRHLLEEHQSGRRDNSGWLWSLLMLELWFESSS